jgi:hypothetical protein
MIRDLGADEVVRDGKGLAAAGGADVILSTSNSTKAMVDSIQGLRPDGRLVTMGADAEPISVSLIDLISKRIRIIGSQQNGPEYLYEALDFVAQGKVKTIVETYPLAEAPKAYERVAEAGTVRRPHNVIADPRRPLFRDDFSDVIGSTPQANDCASGREIAVGDFTDRIPFARYAAALCLCDEHAL